jgi:hypothetical protein
MAVEMKFLRVVEGKTKGDRMSTENLERLKT